MSLEDDKPLERFHRTYVYDPFGNRIELMEVVVRCRRHDPVGRLWRAGLEYFRVRAAGGVTSALRHEIDFAYSGLGSGSMLCR
jgi:hypothetical protein